jgi:hypothetical protein
MKAETVDQRNISTNQTWDLTRDHAITRHILLEIYIELIISLVSLKHLNLG